MTGPYSWRSVAIQGGGFVTGVVFSPVEAGLVYARTDIGGAYRWQAQSSEWIPITDSLGRADSNFMGVESVAADPVDANKVYLAVGTYTQSWAGNGAILRSSDRGQSFQRTAMTIKMGANEIGRSAGERLAVDPNQNSILFFGSRKDGLWKSTDSAVTWSRVAAFAAADSGNGVGSTFIQFDKRAGASGAATRTLYAGVASTTTGLFRSTDAGVSWQAVPGQPTGVMPNHAALASDGLLYLSYGNAPGPNDVTNGAVWKLDTGSGEWRNVTPAAPGSVQFGYGAVTVDARRAGTVMVTTIDRWATGDGIYRTTNGGTSWTELGATGVRDDAGAKWLYWHRTTPSATGWMGDIDIDPFDSDHVFHVTGQGVWGSSDATKADSGQATRWSFRSSGLEETAVLDLASPPSGASLLSALGDIAGFKHDDLAVSPAGGMFDNPIFGNTTSLDFAESNPMLVARVGTTGTASDRRGAFSTDGGNAWTPFGSEPAGSGGQGAIAISADGTTLVWAPRDSAPAYSRDRGAVWTPTSGLPNNLKPVSDRVSSARFYAYDALGGRLYASSDRGATFAARASGLPTLPDYALGDGGVQPVPGIDGELWLNAGTGGLRHSTDGGATFTAVAGVAEASAFGFGKAAEGSTYPALFLIGKVGDVVGFFRSDDSGKSWKRINDDNHQFGWASTISGDPRLFGRVYVGTNGRGILYGDPVR